MEQTKIAVPADVYDGLEAVRVSGRTNMLDAFAVIALPFEMEHYATALWVAEHRKEYAAGLFKGFRVADPDPDMETEASPPPDDPAESRHVPPQGASEAEAGKQSEEPIPGEACGEDGGDL